MNAPIVYMQTEVMLQVLLKRHPIDCSKPLLFSLFLKSIRIGDTTSFSIQRNTQIKKAKRIRQKVQKKNLGKQQIRTKHTKKKKKKKHKIYNKGRPKQAR